MLLIKNPNLWASIDEILAVPEVFWVAQDIMNSHEESKEEIKVDDWKKVLFKKKLYLDHGFSDDENTEDLVINTECHMVKPIKIKKTSEELGVINESIVQ